MNNAEMGESVLYRTENKWTQVSWKQKFLKEKYIRIWRSKGSNAIRHGNFLIYHPGHIPLSIELLHFDYSFCFSFTERKVLKVFMISFSYVFKFYFCFCFLMTGTAGCKLHRNYWVKRFKKTSPLSNVSHCYDMQHSPRVSHRDWSNFPLELSRLLPPTLPLENWPKTLEVNTFYLFILLCRLH